MLQIFNVGRYNLDNQSSEGMQKTELVQNMDISILFLKTKKVFYSELHSYTQNLTIFFFPTFI